VLPVTAKRLLALLADMQARGKVAATSRIYFVDDGSQDRTWAIIEAFIAENTAVHGIRLSRNCGHQNALLAGLLNAKGEALVSIDADLQDDTAVIEQMLDKYCEGYDIVYGVRDNREKDTAFKRFTAEAYYKVLMLMGVKIVFNHADYRLMSRRAIEGLREFSEVNLFLRGLIPQLGFRSSVVHYARSERFAGESKYPLTKMLALAIQGITSFSVLPLRIIMVSGLIISLISLSLGACSAWLGFDRGAAILPRWLAATESRRHRRIPCQGVHGDEAPAAIHRRQDPHERADRKLSLDIE
jgi:glycosyltransferase involved in cell wall biosynthesis